MEVIVHEGRYIFPSKIPGAVFKRSEKDFIIVQEATPEKLVEKLIDPYYRDDDFSHIFFFAYGCWISSEELLERLVQFYKCTLLSPPEWILKRRLKALELIQLWIEKEQVLLRSKPEFCTAIEQFLDDSYQFSFPSEEDFRDQIRLLWFNEIQVHRNTPRLNRDNKIRASSKKKRGELGYTVLDEDTNSLVEQLTLVDHDMFVKIESRECLNQSVRY
eukprot:TRINITY_DN3415_c0_g1_i2.p1 TRINITY_DN3415_c0_g1~~TRINITY_DN3415_c0_g1_i2.p1  ORF type:complete len:217 (-),score=32.08 TRINITY_DN3415_c0_g1_i2:552-1202(-)